MVLTPGTPVRFGAMELLRQQIRRSPSQYNAFDGNPSTYAESTAGTLEVTSSAFTDGGYEVEVKSSGGSSSIT